MFDFEKLDLYQKIKAVNQKVLRLIFSGRIEDAYIADQLKRSTLDIQLNLAEGTGRFADKEKKHFVTVSRSSVFTCVAILDVIHELGIIDANTRMELYEEYETISKMLLGLYRNVSSD